MNAQQLQLADGTKIEMWRCSCCGLCYREREAYTAERCCVCQGCGKQLEPNSPRDSMCWPCRSASWAKRDAERLEKAEEIKDYAGPVVVGGDKYYQTVDDMVDDWDGDTLPEFVHTCRVHSYSLDAADILQNMIENASVEDFEVHDLAGVKEFEAAVGAFNEANKGIHYWEEDSKHKVRVPRELVDVREAK